MDRSDRSESPSPSSVWRSTRNPPAASTRRRGGLAGREVNRRRCGAPLNFWYYESDSSLSPPPARSRISLPILPGRYDNLRGPRRVTGVGLEAAVTPHWVRAMPSDLGAHAVAASRCLGGKPSTGLAVTAVEAFLPAPSSDERLTVETPPPPPIAVEEKGPLESNSCSLGEPFHYRDGFPVYFPFHPTTEEWAAVEAEVEADIDREIAQRGFPGR